MRLIACFSSTPFSIFHAKKTLISLQLQTLPPDEIHWFLPDYSKRFQIKYPSIPFDTDEFSTLTVHRVEDLGPNTKIAHLLDLQGIQDDDRIIIFDDDTVYDSRAVQTLVQSARNNQGTGFLGHTFVHVPFQYKIRSSFGNAQSRDGSIKCELCCVLAW